MKEIDVRGLSCPEPVMQVLDEMEQNKGEFKVLVSEAHVVKNISKVLDSAGKKYDVAEDGLDFVITVK